MLFKARTKYCAIAAAESEKNPSRLQTLLHPAAAAAAAEDAKQLTPWEELAASSARWQKVAQARGVGMQTE